MQRMMYWIVAAAWASQAWAQPVSPPTRFQAEFADGKLVAGDELRPWHNTDAQPTLAGQALFDPQLPVRSVVDTTLRMGPTPESYIEFVTGDRLPGRVVGARSGLESPFHRQFPHLLVEGHERWLFPGLPALQPLRVISRWVKRVVWEPRAGEEYRPGTLFYRDGRRLSFQAVRWGTDSLLLLLENNTSEVSWHEIAELHLPESDAWRCYVEQLALLGPAETTRLFQWETIDGLRVLGSPDRFQAKSHGNENDPNNWYHLVQPAWSLDPLWVSHRSIRVRRYFLPHEVPVTLLEPQTDKQTVLARSGWSPQRNRNVQGGILKTGDREFAWGWGVQARQELRFTLPPGAAQFQASVALDRCVGSGGCVRVSVAGGAGEQLWPADPAGQTLIGSTTLAAIGPLAVAGKNQLVLVADPFISGHPAGADPFDIRDVVNWLEPVVHIPPAELQSQIHRAASGLVPAFEGWEIVDASTGPFEFFSRWQTLDHRDPRFVEEIRPRGPFLILKRTQKVTPQQNLLLILASRYHNEADDTTLQIRIDGDSVAELQVPKRHSPADPDPLVVPLAPYLGKNIQLEVSQLGAGPKAVVQWQGLIMQERHPGLLTVWDDDRDRALQLTQGEGNSQWDEAVGYSGTGSLKVQGGDSGNANWLPSVIRIREQPKLGEFRFIRFVWKKPQGKPIALQLASDGKWGEQDTNQERVTYRYDAGEGPRVMGGARRIDGKLPKEWTVVTRDLVADWGEFNLTGLSFVSLEGEPAWFDQIELARTPNDFQYSKPSEHPSRAEPKKN